MTPEAQAVVAAADHFEKAFTHYQEVRDKHESSQKRFSQELNLAHREASRTTQLLTQAVARWRQAQPEILKESNS